MKLAALLLLFPVIAFSSTVITLNPAGGWGRLHQYHQVSTNAVPDDPVTMYLPQLANYSGGMQLWFASEEPPTEYGDYYDWKGTFIPQGVSSLSQEFCSGPLIDRGGFYSKDCALTGKTMALQITETTRRVCNHSGRGQSCGLIWTLTGGIMVMQ